MNVEDETPEIVLSIVVIIILIVFFGYILYLLFSSNFQSTSPNNPVTSDNRVDNTIICPAGECAIKFIHKWIQKMVFILTQL